MEMELKEFKDTKAIVQLILHLNEVKALIKEWYERYAIDSYSSGSNFKESRETIDNKFEEAKKIYIGLVEKYTKISNVEISLLLLCLESLFLSIELFIKISERF